MSLTVAVTGLHMGENPQPGSGVIRSLRDAYCDLTIVGLVYDVLESGIYADNSADVIYHLPYPKAGSEALLARLDYVLAQQPIDILIPSLDAEMQGLLKIEQELAERGIKMMLPALESFKACRKAELENLAEQCDCYSPKTMTAVEVNGLRQAAKEIGYPLFVKGPFYGAHKVHNEATLISRFHQIISEWGGPVVLQESIDGSEFDVISVGDGQGNVGGFCAIRKTIVTDKGKGFGGITVRDERLDGIAMNLIQELNWRGPLELEFVKDEENDEFYLIEINPRFPAWVGFPSTIGHNLPSVVIETLTTGAMPQLPECPTGKFFVRHSVDVTGDVEQLGQLSTFGELCGQTTGDKVYA